MIKIKEAIVVEGNYDKIKLSRIVDTTIIVTDGSWTNIEYNDTEERLVNYALNSKVTVEGLDEEDAAEAQNIVDGIYNTTLTVTEDDEVKVIVDLKKSKAVDKILVGWTGYYARSYVMETSVDGKEWTTIYEKDKGGGGTDAILLDEAVECRYIRLSEFDKQGRRNPTLAEIEVYGEETCLESEIQRESGIFSRLYEMRVLLIAVAITVVVLVSVIVIGIIKKKRRQKNISA